MEGWIKLHRVLREKPIWTTSNCFQRTLLVILLLMANHKGTEWEWRGERYRVEPGQFITSISSLKKEMGKEGTDKKIRNGLDRFKKYGFLVWEATHRNRLITIVNWGMYQSVGRQKGKPEAVSCTGEGRFGATNKNEEKEENGNKKKTAFITRKETKRNYAEFVQLTVKEFSSLLDRFGEQGTAEMITILDHYKGASPEKRRYQSDFRAILSWVVKKYEDEQNRKKQTKQKSPLMVLALGKDEEDDVAGSSSIIDIGEKNPFRN